MEESSHASCSSVGLFSCCHVADRKDYRAARELEELGRGGSLNGLDGCLGESGFENYTGSSRVEFYRQTEAYLAGRPWMCWHWVVLAF
jgi:hypothetical protein